MHACVHITYKYTNTHDTCSCINLIVYAFDEQIFMSQPPLSHRHQHPYPFIHKKFDKSISYIKTIMVA